MKHVLIAYIDPGSGALILQWIVAAVVGSGIFFRSKIKAFFRIIFGKKNNPDKEKTEENN